MRSLLSLKNIAVFLPSVRGLLIAKKGEIKRKLIMSVLRESIAGEKEEAMIKGLGWTGTRGFKGPFHTQCYSWAKGSGVQSASQSL